MDTLTLNSSHAIALASGIASFFLYFHVGEHHMHGMTYFLTFMAACIIGTLGLVNISHMTIGAATALVLSVGGSWLAGVYGSCLVWRAFFNELNKVPGPWMARISKFYICYRCRNLDAYKVIADLHANYGRYVRLGPNDISIADPDAMQLAYGPNSTVTKSQWYDAGAPHHSMHTSRDKALHDRRRRFWAPAFSDKALREYEIIVQTFNDKLLRRIEEFQGTPMNVTKWFNLYSFDVMGRLAFGKDYSMLDSGERHWALDLLTKGMEAGAWQPPMWAFRFALAVPGLAASFHKFLNFCAEEMKWRVERGDSDGHKDITGWLLKAYKDHKHPERDPYLQGDARLIIVAGSDTSAATLTYMFYHLALNPNILAELRRELKPLTRGDWGDNQIKNADYLNGVINETLRLHPPVPSGVSRKTSAHGLQIGDNFVPGNVHFVIPQYLLGRDESIYDEPLSFIPERWFSKPDMIKHPDAFAPFSLGPFNCIGKNLAYMEIRTMAAQIVLGFDVALAKGEDGTRLMTETHDHFTLSLGQLDLVFTPAAR